MCIIIDSNKAHDFCADPADEAEPIHAWLQKGGKIVYCTTGKYGRELQKSTDFRIKLADLARGKQAIPVSEEELMAEEKRMEETNICKSNDIHILALAKVSGARLLYTCDGNLMGDFKDKRILDNPRGKIYSGIKNKTLLKSSACKKTT